MQAQTQQRIVTKNDALLKMNVRRARDARRSGEKTMEILSTEHPHQADSVLRLTWIKRRQPYAATRHMRTLAWRQQSREISVGDRVDTESLPRCGITDALCAEIGLRGSAQCGRRCEFVIEHHDGIVIVRFGCGHRNGRHGIDVLRLARVGPHALINWCEPCMSVC